MPKETPKRLRSSTRRKPIKFKSKFEGKVSDLLSKNGLDGRYEKVILPYTLDLKYKPDWELHKDVFLEAKGKFDYEDRRKMAAVRDQHPEVDVRMIFMRNQKLGKGSKMTYGGWCDMHNIRWSVYPELPYSEKELEDLKHG